MNILVTANAYGTNKVLELGQPYYVPVVAAAGGSGIELRRELFKHPPFPLEELAKLVREHRLTAVYSSPEPIWLDNGNLNDSQIQNAIQEGTAIGASIIKLPLGNYDASRSDLHSLQQLLQSFSLLDKGIDFTVENDQTAFGGKLENIAGFLADCKASEVPIQMTFDIGNWKWTDTNVFEAAEQLKEYVVYIHCKHVEKLHGSLMTLPLPEEESSPWRLLLSLFSSEIPRAIEFPIEGNDLTQQTAEYIRLLADTAGVKS